MLRNNSGSIKSTRHSEKEADTSVLALCTLVIDLAKRSVIVPPGRDNS